jgi:hypothetical protein
MPNFGNPIPLEIQLFDGNPNQFVRARVFTNAGAEVSGSPVALPIVAGSNGLYQALGPAMPNVPSVTVQYKVYQDSGFTTPSPTYADSVESQEQTYSAVQNAAQTWATAQSTAVTAGTFGAALQGVISAARANNLDNLNAAITSIANLLGAPIGASVSADVATIIAKTSQLGFTGGNVNANTQVNSDKAGYALSGSALTDIANAIWNSMTVNYTSAGSYGLLLGTASTVVAPSSVSAIVAGVWNALSSSYLASGSMGAVLASLNTNVSVNLSTLATQAAVASLAATVASLATQSSVNSIFPILGSPVNGSLALDTAAVKSDTGTLVSRLTAGRAGNLDYLTGPLSAAATQSSVNSIIGLLGTPVVSVSADLASVKSNTQELSTNYTAGRAANLDNLDAAVSTRATQSLVSSIYALLGTPATTIAGDIANLATTLATLPTASQIWAYSTRSLNVTVAATVDLSALATASQLTATEAAILSAINAYKVQSTVSVDPNADTVTALVWLTLENQIVSAPTSASAQIYNAAGTMVLDLGTQTSYTPGGIFEFQAGGAIELLPANQSYTLRSTVVQTPYSFTGTKGFTTFT